MSKTCEDCDNCLCMDYGYSNWTVEGTTVVCMVKAHPKPEFDRFYGENPDMQFAAQCPRFSPGGAHLLDVDHEDLSTLPQWVQDFITTEGHHYA